MILKTLSLTNYKNIEATTLTFSDKLNCVIGANGMGKTNLLDSIYYLSFTRTCAFLPDSMVVRYGAEMAVLDGRYLMEQKEESLYCGIRLGKPKVIRRNKKEYTKISDHIGAFPLVMISPVDLELIRGGSEERRKFMDMILSQESSSYLLALISYRKLLEQRNSMLKAKVFNPELLEIIEEQMVPHALRITQMRHEWSQRLLPIFLEYYHTIAGEGERVQLLYRPVMDKQACTREGYLAAMRAARERDFALGHSSFGPHKDDLEMLLGEYLIRKVGSQGQCKSYMVALKFAQYRLLRDLRPSNPPILLLDDLFDKLDADRVDRIIRIVSGDDFGQIFISDTNRKYLDRILLALPGTEYSLFSAEAGSFSPIV